MFLKIIAVGAALLYLMLSNALMLAIFHRFGVSLPWRVVPCFLFGALNWYLLARYFRRVYRMR